MRSSGLLCSLGVAAFAAAEPIGTRDSGRPTMFDVSKLEARDDLPGNKISCGGDVLNYPYPDCLQAIQQWADRGSEPIDLGPYECSDETVGNCVTGLCRAGPMMEGAPARLENSYVVDRFREVADVCFGLAPPDRQLTRYAFFQTRWHIQLSITPKKWKS